jgi:peptidyl-prolyl cis-trans isomerase SurA
MRLTRAIAFILLFSSGLAAQDKKAKVVEEIVVRVNNEIITTSDLLRSRSTLAEEIRQDCPTCTDVQIQAALKDKQQNLLRDLIDQSLLVQKGKDLNINVEPDVIKQLDRIRQQNKLADMEALEDELRKAGINYEDYKGSIRNNILTQEVIRREVSSRILVGKDEVNKYYQEHKSEFIRPEMVYLREFFLSTDKKTEEEIPKVEEKAKGYLARIRKGEDFEELTRHYSEGTTAKQGGSLGGYQRGQLAKEIEELVFKMKRGEMTEVIRTKTGFLVLKVEERFEAGQQPVEKVEPEIMNRLYAQKTEPQLRAYLAVLREESYLVVKPGYVDTAAVASTPIVEVEPSADTDKNGKKGKKDKKDKRAGAKSATAPTGAKKAGA